MRALVVIVLGILACDAGPRPPTPAPPPAPVPVAKVVAPTPPTPVEQNLPEAPISDPAPTPILTQAGAPKHEPGALVLILDRSGSMQGAKLEAAKEAARAVVEVLEPTDEVAVITFDSDATLVSPLQKASARTKIQASVSEIVSGGGTNVLPALTQALASLQSSKLKHKHIILLSDGEAPTDGIREILDKLAAEGATTSTIGVAGADRNFLSMIADAGSGRLYMVEDLGALPKIFMKELKVAFKR